MQTEHSTAAEPPREGDGTAAGAGEAAEIAAMAPQPIIAGIGASAGGIEALQAFFGALPENLGVAFVVVVHLSPEHRSELAAVLAPHTPMPVEQVSGTVPLRADHVYVVPPGRRLQITDSEVSAVPFDEPRGQRAPIDHFFRSLAEEHGDGFAVVLSGGGSDGAVGVKAIKEAGGLVLVQDPEEAAYDSMPRAAIATEVADLVLPVRELAGRLSDLTHTKRRVRETLVAEARGDLEGDAVVGRILAHLHARTGHDFSKYKRATVLRRLGRRMQVHRKETLDDYLAFLRTNPEEAQALFNDLLISVTTFFRDPEAWEALADQVVPRLFEGEDAPRRIRVWVPGCATGEEAYSLAILLLEEAHRRDLWPEVQIFATDLDEGALATAREGRYPTAIEADVSEERLHRFFRREGEHYCVSREVRDCVLFAVHSLLRDPPFSRLELVSCRNLLIYLDRGLQQQVFGIFRYALRPGGNLFLGASESAEGQYFRVLDKKHRLYQVREAQAAEVPHLPDLLLRAPRLRTPAEHERLRSARKLPEAVHRRALEELAPPSILVDEERSVVHLSETAGRFLQPPGGPLTREVTRLVRPELQVELRAGLYRAFEQGEGSLSPFVPVELDGRSQRVAVLVRPRTGEGENGERWALVVFVEGGEVTSGPAVPAEGEPGAAAARHLEEELRHARERLRGTREEYEAANEELRSANEELQSLAEEYRSTAEELETSKEELHSINEELETVNHELKMKLQEVSRAHSDLENLMSATEIGTLFLDRGLHIARFTPSLTEIFNVTETDHGRPITDFTHRLDYPGLVADARGVLENLVPVEREARSAEGRWFLARLRPYRTPDDGIDGVVATFVEITERKRAEEALRQSEERYRLLVEGVAEYGIFMMDPEGRIVTWNTGAERLFGYSEQEALGRSCAIIFPPEAREQGAPEDEMALAAREGQASDERWHLRRDGSRFWGSGVMTALRHPDGSLRGFAKVLRDDSDLKAAEAARIHFQALFESAPGLYLVLEPEEYTIVAVSDAFLQATRTRREAIMGRALFDVFPADPSEPGTEGMRNLRASFERVKAERRADAMAAQRYPIPRPAEEGGGFEERWWSLINSPVLGPERDLAYIIQRVEDVTPFILQMREQGREAEGHRLLESRAQHMEAEIVLRARELQRTNERLRQLNEALEERIVERERLLAAAQQAREEAEIANEAKSGFMATMSHELRTPLNAVVAYAELLERGIPVPIPAAARQHTERILLSSRLLTYLIDDMLTFSRIEADREAVVLERIELRPLLDEIEAIAAPLAAAKDLVFHLTLPEGAPGWIVTDPRKLRSVLLNLVGNAVKFTERGEVELTVRALPQAVGLQVRDTGIGIAAEDLERLFEPFWQRDSSLTRTAGGAGLGLAITRRFVAMLGGTIEVESRPGEGSLFQVRLPDHPGEGNDRGQLSVPP